MNRRDSLKLICKSMGIAASLTQVNHSWATAVLSTQAYQFKILNNNQQQLIIELIDIILPSTHSFGGNDLNLVFFIDDILFNTERKEEQLAFIHGANSIALELKSKDSRELIACYFDISPSQQQQIFIEQAEPLKQIELYDNNQYYCYRFLLKVRQLAMTGFYYAEETAKQLLNYEPITKEYQPCTQLQQTGKNKGKSWAE